ncbi:hypothetical protein AB6A40_004926 [Gnathostoma spinigerum]|uniref:Uncharacterized protein n=1 Tax=Gnathostoma spinigerum TaxID=75299 RepID=A0ABD6ENU1_9BILA
MNEAREALLKVAVNASDNEETALLRGSSTRFHVSPSGNVRDTSVNREDRGRSEPPNNNALLSINKSEHKVSTVSGRFRVVGSDLEAVLMQNNGNFDEFYVSRPPSPHTSPVVEESSSPIPLSSSDGTKSVHFCVGDNTILSDSSRHSELSSERDHNTYQNIKSWR